MPGCRTSYSCRVHILLAAVVVIAAVVAWTAFEARMVARLARDTRPLASRNAAVAGAFRLSVLGQTALLALAVVVAGLTSVQLWWNPVAVAEPLVGGLVTAVLLVGVGVACWWTARRGPAPHDRRALFAVAVTALSTEVLLRGLGLALLDEAGSPVTVAVLVTAVTTGVLQAWRSGPGNRANGFVLATVLGFALGLVVVLTGSVLAAAAVHVAVSVLALARTFPDRSHPAGCACGHDHSAPPATPSTEEGGPSTAMASTPATTAAATTATTPGPAAGHATGAHASCGTTCDHAGTSACAVCPLSAAKV